jgi:hypothetical protein
VEYIIINATKDMNAIPQTPFKQYFGKWERQWESSLLCKETLLKMIIL